MKPFDPIEVGFVMLAGFSFPGDVVVYEHANHPCVDGTPDFLRLNLYLSKDGTFVTIWHGLVEPMFAASRLVGVELPVGFDFDGEYREDLFRGYIDTEDEARVILKALRVGAVEGARYLLPQPLGGGSDNRLRCDVVVNEAL